MKPKINGRNISVFFLLCLTALVGSCIVEESFKQSDFSTDQALAIEAEEWYRENIQSILSNNARSMQSNSLIDGDPLWNKAKTLNHKGRQIIEIPVRMRVSELFAGKGLEFRKRSNDYRLLLFKLKNGKFRPYLFKIELDSKDNNLQVKDFKDLNLTSIPSSFSGKYSFFSLDGRFVGSWEIQQGKQLRAQSFKQPKPSKAIGNENDRTSTIEYSCTVTTYTTYVQAGNGQPQIVEQYEVWDCVFTFMPETIAPPSSTDPDSGGEDPGCYEPHPDFEGFMIPCGSLDPECPCCHLPESQRAPCEADEPPCEDLPMKTMELASPGASGKNGGRYGMTRSNGKKFHDGLDIAAEPGTYVYSPFSGKISRIDSSFSPGEYREVSYGNFVTVESTDANGNKFYLRYCHLNYTLVEFGDEIEAGQVIGISGDTGNAKNVANKHVHVLGAKKDSNGQIVNANPEDYLKTKWDSSGNISVDPCDN